MSRLSHLAEKNQGILSWIWNRLLFSWVWRTTMGSAAEKTERVGKSPPPDGGDEEKLAQLILYVSDRCATHKLFGATKLNKILYLADMYSFLHTGKAITGVPYRKLEKGPVPKRLVQVRNKLEEEGALAVKTAPVYSLSQERTIALKDPDLSDFTGSEIALVDSVIEQLKDKTSKEVSDLTHKMAGWTIAKYGEDIPYVTILIDDEPQITEVQLEQAKRVKETYGDL